MRRAERMITMIARLIAYCESHETIATPCGHGINVIIPWYSVKDDSSGIFTVYCETFSDVRKALGY
jgi:hypothetical protein